MPDAFGNIWPQYQRGHRKMYAPQTGAAPGPAPFVGAPIGAEDNQFESIGDASGESRGAGATVKYPDPSYDPTTAYNPNWVNPFPGGPPAGFTPSPEEMANRAYTRLPVDADPDAPYLAAMAHHSRQAAAHTAAANAAASQVRRAQPVLTDGAYTFPNQPQPMPGLGQRILQTLGHFFTGTLGQYPPLGQTSPSAGYSFGPSPGPGQVGPVISAAPRAQPATVGDLTATQQPSDFYSRFGGAAQVNEPNYAPRAQPTTVADWIASEKDREAQAKALKGGGQGGGGGSAVSLGKAPPFVGQPMGGFGNMGDFFSRLFQGQQGQRSQQGNQPVSDPSELSQQDLSGLSSSGGGEPQSRYQMGPFNPQLTNVGGFTGAGGTAGSGLAPLQTFVGGLASDLSKSRGGGAGASPSGGYTFGPSPGPGQVGEVTSEGGGGGIGGMAGGSGMGPAQLGSLAASVLQSFGKLAQEANAPVSVDPREWANPPPQPPTFSFPTLARNYGYTY